MPIRRSHRLLPHTADAGLEAVAPDLAGVFEEAALAIAELTSDGATAAGDGQPEPVELVGRDLPALAVAWLDELIGLIDARVSAVAGTDVRSVEAMPDGWRMTARVRLVPVDGRRVRRRSDVKSATYHRLLVEPVAGGWRLVAYVDV